ncbi:unnamed protein product [Acanthoscelides obtectus]|uniref:Uncharacterized protein n=1 Tax=Acanthoscelides obtectus TaxID=200917 RepID=A0A9P0LH56_ACAOB|nr:unnamed protein product [Acanthoscelides obtectus]CAK1622433.1 hypothetical protein AOBTE_LOCUS1477 [Acanthoscelides obtectus]
MKEDGPRPLLQAKWMFTVTLTLTGDKSVIRHCGGNCVTCWCSDIVELFRTFLLCKLNRDWVTAQCPGSIYIKEDEYLQKLSRCYLPTNRGVSSLHQLASNYERVLSRRGHFEDKRDLGAVSYDIRG